MCNERFVKTIPQVTYLPFLAIVLTYTSPLFSSFQLKTWLQKLIPNTSHVSESRIYLRISAIQQTCFNLPQDEVKTFLQTTHDFDTLPDVLVSLGLNRLNIHDPDSYSQPPQDDVSNEVVITLSQVLSKDNRSPTFVRKWLVLLSESCKGQSDSRLRTAVANAVKKQKRLSKDGKKNELDLFLKSPFLIKQDQSQSADVGSANIPVSQTCHQCLEKDALFNQHKILLSGKENAIDILKNENAQLISSNQKLGADLSIKTMVVAEIQNDKRELSNELQNIKTVAAEIPVLKKKIKEMQLKLNEVTDTKLYYKRNTDLKDRNEVLEVKVKTLEENLKLEQTCNIELKKKIKSEQDMKNKYKKKSDLLTEEKERCLSALNSVKSEEDIVLTQKEEKCVMYSDNVRQLYMALQGEANVAASQASKVVQLVSKHLFKKDLSLDELPCPRTCLNFMTEANHIAKQHIVSEIRDNNHFTYGTDGTSRSKKHYMEHHIVLDNGSTLSVGFSEVADDRADTLLEKSLDIFDELSDVYCQTEKGSDKNEIFQCILSKLMSLMSDRAANMKLFNKNMLQHKKNLLGEDATLHFLYCNAHFLIGLAGETEKTVRCQESYLEETSGVKLGRASQSAFKHWSSEETAASRLIRTASDVFGPRGDEKNGCREEWLAHCDSCQVKSQFSSYRSNRFNNLFENSQAIIFHRHESLHFLQNRASHSNLKLQSICFDLDDCRLLSIITAIAFFSKHLTTPYWSLMNSHIPYGKFPAYVQAMKAALERWSSDEFEIVNLRTETPVFGGDFATDSDVADTFFSSDDCDAALATTMFKMISKQCIEVLDRQLHDFLPGGVYGDVLPLELQKFLDTCPLTNLTGERMFGDLDYDMTRRRRASTLLRSTVNMWKHNKTSRFLDQKSPNALRNTMASGRKHGKELKLKHAAAVKRVREKIKARILENERKKVDKDVQDKERQSALLNDILSQGGLCQTKADLDQLSRGPNALQNLKAQIRFRKFYMNAKELRITGNFNSLFNGLCNHLGLEYDEVSEPARKKRKVTTREKKDSDSDEMSKDDHMDCGDTSP